MRVCTPLGALDFDFKDELANVPEGLIPWFDMPNRASADHMIIFGHWSALGLHQRENVHALDTGCLWGRKLTALCLETKAVFQVPADIRDVQQLKA